MLSAKDVRRVPVEIDQVPLVRHGEALDGDAVDLFLTGGKLVAPGDVVTRAGGQHAHVRVPGQALSNGITVERCNTYVVDVISKDPNYLYSKRRRWKRNEVVFKFNHVNMHHQLVDWAGGFC